MKAFLSFLLVVLSLNLLSCNHPETEIACDIKNPARNLPWLKAKIDTFTKTNICADNACRMLIYQVKTGNQQLIVTWVTGPAVDGIPQYYTCNGELVICTDQEPCPTLHNAKIIWESKSE